MVLVIVVLKNTSGHSLDFLQSRGRKVDKI